MDPKESKEFYPQSLLAEGSYGCTFYPPLRCKKSKGSRAERSRKVGKITRKVNAEYELEVSQVLKGIPGWDMYFAVQEEESCTKSEIESIQREYREDCTFFKRSDPKSLMQIIAPYAGIPLRQYPITHTFPLLKWMEHCAKGLKLMHDKGYGHFDIHEMNMMIDSKGITRFIDFGKSMKGDSINDTMVRKHTFSFTPGFVWQAPELALMNAIQGGMTESSAIPQIIEKKTVFRDIQNYLGIRRLIQEEMLRDFWNFSDSAQHHEWAKLFRHYWRKFDVWSLGVVYIHILKMLLVNTKFITETWPMIGSRVRRCLQGMLVASPLRRSSIDAVLELLDH